MKTLSLDNGWIVTQKNSEDAILHVLPIPNSLFGKEQDVIIPNTIFEDIQSGEKRIKELFRKHKLHDVIFQSDKSKFINPSVNKNTKCRFFGVGFLLTKEKKSYFLEYELAKQGGGHRKIEISKVIYEEAKTGQYSISDLFKKYNLYHLDISENDVK
jgi:hypothetical protein